MTQIIGCSMTFEEIKELVLFMKAEHVEAFQVGDVKVSFSASSFISDLISEKEPESKSAADIQREEEELLYAST